MFDGDKYNGIERGYNDGREGVVFKREVRNRFIKKVIFE